MRYNLTVKMLGLDVLKSPQELYESMMDNHFLDNQQFMYDAEYFDSYQWLSSIIKPKVDLDTNQSEIYRQYSALL